MDPSKTSDEEINLQNLLTSAWNKSKAKDSKIQEQAEEIQELKRKLEGNRRQSGSPSPSVILTGGRLTEEPFQGEQRVNERVGDRRENPIEVEREGSVHAEQPSWDPRDKVWRCKRCFWELEMDWNCSNCHRIYVKGEQQAGTPRSDRDITMESEAEEEEVEVEKTSSLKDFVMDDEDPRLEKEQKKVDSNADAHSSDCDCEDLDLKNDPLTDSDLDSSDVEIGPPPKRLDRPAEV